MSVGTDDGSYTWPTMGSGGGVPIYPTFASIPAGTTQGQLAVAADTGTLYEWNGSAWVPIATPGDALSIGVIDTGSPSANGAHIQTGGALIMQSASVSNPGLVNTTTQSFAGNKTFTGTIAASNFSGSSSGTNTGDLTLGTANGLSIAGQVLSLGLSSISTTGALSSTDWNTFNGKQSTISIGALDAQAENANGLAFVSNVLSAQSADATHPGMVNITTQSFGGQKTHLDTTTFIANSGTSIIAAFKNSTSSIEWDWQATAAELQLKLNGALFFSMAVDNTGVVGFGGLPNDEAMVDVFGRPSKRALTLYNNATTPGDLLSAIASDQSTLLARIKNDGTLNSASLTASTALVSDASKNIISAATTATEIGYVSGVTGAIQTQLNGKQASGNYITDLTGDGTASGPGSSALTLATVNSNVGSFGSSTSIPSFTVNGKGLITAASSNVVIAPAGTLSGTTLNSTVVSSSLTSVGTITSGTWNGTTIAIANGGTGQTSKSAAFDALSPMTTGGDIIYGGASGTGTRLANGSAGNILQSNGGTAAPSWVAPSATVPGSYYYCGYYPASTSNYWTNTSNTFGDFTVVGTIPTITALNNSNFGSVTNATSNLPGLGITAPRTGTIRITVTAAIIPGLNASSASWGFELFESSTSTIINFTSGGTLANSVTGASFPVTIVGYFPATLSTAYNFKVRGAISTGTFYIGDFSTAGSELSFSMEYIT